MIVLGDLGSAILTARAVLAGQENGHVRLADAPLVEGAVAAAVTASAGLSLDDVERRREGGRRCRQALRRPRRCRAGVDLHARPAAQLRAHRARLPLAVAVAAGDREADAKSLLSVLALGAKAGTTLRLRADGDDGPVAIEALGRCVAGLTD